MYEVVFRELLSQASPGKPSKQAPRMHASMLQGLEGLVCDKRALPYVRLYGWWLLVQNWCTLRFSDHRGVHPSDVQFSAAGLTAVLTRSKTVGVDEAVQSRAIVLDSSRYISEPTWLATGWQLFHSLADFPRD